MSKQIKSRLGRGLSSLLSVSELPVQSEAKSEVREAASGDGARMASTGGGTIDVPIEQISPNPHQPRREFAEGALAELAASLKSTGLVQPIVVRKTDGGYQLIAGERRLRAAKLAGMTAIPAILRDVDAFTQAQMALVENIHRADLNPIERALAYQALIRQLGLTQAELATRLGEDRSSVTNYIRLLDLAEAVREHIRTGVLTMGHAKVLAGVADVVEQERLANLAVSQALSVRNLERLTQAPTQPAAPTSKPTAESPHIQELEKSFARQLGMRVQIRTSGSKSKGRVVIHYASLDQFDQLLEKLGIPTDFD